MSNVAPSYVENEQVQTTYRDLKAPGVSQAWRKEEKTAA